MRQWQVRAEFENGGVMLFGVQAEDGAAARAVAEARVTRLDRTCGLWVTPVRPPPPE